ncbi:uncharacterized protein LOC128887624 [Hylaeus anthracinus]|uniref:uncharacterized protein LOC128887624 n=1 Tax=Hylaeus anthracinus TaxID=313031 RepID=UPI0023B91D23|nr:uncharacterized protein LOC128887624 [Hylaeus anthracinus]
MKSLTLSTLFILAVAYSLMVQATHQECKCGNLGPGTNPCTCTDSVVTAAKLPEPTYYVSPQDINDAAAARNSQNSQSDSQSISTPVTYTISESDSTIRSSSGSSLLPVPQTDVIPVPSESSSRSNSGCGCAKQTSETQTGDSIIPTSNSGKIVPSFPPIGDLCYPLPVDPRSGKLLLIEKTKVTPAYPGKIICSSCTNPSPNQLPYEICMNVLTGETTTRIIETGTLGTTSGSSPTIFAKPNSPVPGISTSGGNGVTTGTLPGAPTANRLGLFGNLYPKTYSGSRPSLLPNINLGTFSRSRSRMYGHPHFGLSQPSFGMYNIPPARAIGQKQFSITGSTSNCFDDDTDETVVDHSYPEMPADAVSLTLAYKNLRAPNVIYRQGKQFIPEDKLSFGHRTVPNESKNDKKTLDIPEEKLVMVEKPVVELKLAPPRTVVIGSYDEQEEAKLAELEAIERESITQEESADQMSESLLTYKDLGYAPVGSVYMKSRKHNHGIINGEINDSAEEPCGPLGPPIPDYIPGKVIVQETVIEDNFGNPGNIEIHPTNPPCPQ